MLQGHRRSECLAWYFPKLADRGCLSWDVIIEDQDRSGDGVNMSTQAIMASRRVAMLRVSG